MTDHFSSDELMFNAYTKLVAGMLGSSGITQSVGIPKGCLELVFNDPREIEKLNPPLTFVEEQIWWQIRGLSRILALWPILAQQGS